LPAQQKDGAGPCRSAGTAEVVPVVGAEQLTHQDKLRTFSAPAIPDRR
jgi:hypothetical protein